MREPADVVVESAVVVTMDPSRQVFADGAVALRGDRIVAVGPTAEVLAAWAPAERVDGRRFVVTPGLVNTHVHVVGEPLTRGFVPDDTPFRENVHTWLRPLYAAHTEEDEHLSAQLAAAEMLRSGTTAFLEAGSVRHVAAVVDALTGIGIRARFGVRAEDRSTEPAAFRQTTAQAAAAVESTLSRYREVAGGRLQAWAMLVGHTACSDELWQAAARSARDWETGLNFHMSPAAGDPEWFLREHGARPLVHLDRLGVLGDNCVVVHAVHVDDAEIDVLARRGCTVSHCPTTALKVAYGVTRIGRVPEMAAAGINVAIGIDGSNASNYADMMRATYLVAGLFKDARQDASLFPATEAFAMATLGGARALLAGHEIGSLEVGKKADLVLHDRRRPEWTPLHDVANQLVWSADGRGVHTVFVDGRRVVDDYRLTTVDEPALYARAQAAGEALVARSGLRRTPAWPVR
ncbi:MULTISPECIES: amidohydrolase family protein [unclassified Blastococcus]